MSNPVTELMELLDSWNIPSRKPVVSVRSGSGSVGPGLWRSLAPAVRLISAVEDRLDAIAATGREVSSFQRILGYAYAGVFMPEDSWSTAQERERKLLSADHRAALETLAIVLDAETSGDLPAANLSRILELLNEADAVARDSLGESEAARKLNWLIAQARRFADDMDRFGEAAFMDLVIQAAGEGQRVAESGEGSEESAGKLRSVFSQILIQAAGSSVGSAMVLGAGLTARAIGVG